MGKTLPTVRNQIEALRDELMPFRRGMKPQNQEYYDSVWENIRYLAMPTKVSGRIDTKWVMLFAAAVAQQRQLDQLEERLDEQVEALEDISDVN